ncbi:MAG: HD-GYP domain-containing protein, partial [Acidimicrobiia bacterium]|nr:HD-GYP domain-containing protein [Acidimicrobiia bacterium]
MSAFGGSASTLASEVEQRTWQARPGLARLVRVAVALAPVAAATVVTRVMASLVPRPALPVEFGLWLLSMIGLATLVLVVVDRQARRLLPLAALLQLSLVFPDRAPSKFSLALRSGNIRRLTDADASFSSAGVYAAELLRLVIQLGRHDRFTRGHSERVRAYTAMIAGELGLTPSEANLLQWAALLHDVGKLGVPQTILNKPAPPDAAEWAVLRSHPGAGAHYLGPLREWLGEWAGAVDEHHERFDGTGYPRGLAGEDISFGGRIVAVADAYDVMTSTRAYKRPLSRMAARAELMRGSGSQFDPRVVRATLNASIGSMHWSAAVVTWLSQLQLLATQVPAASAAITASVAVGAAGTATLVDLPAWRAPVHEVA